MVITKFQRDKYYIFSIKLFLSNYLSTNNTIINNIIPQMCFFSCIVTSMTTKDDRGNVLSNFTYSIFV